MHMRSSHVAFILGLALYNRYLAHLAFRRVFYLGHCLLFLISSLDLLWVGRLNRQIGGKPPYTLYPVPCTLYPVPSISCGSDA